MTTAEITDIDTARTKRAKPADPPGLVRISTGAGYWAMAPEPWRPEGAKADRPAGLYRREGRGETVEYIRCAPMVTVAAHATRRHRSGIHTGRRYILEVTDPATGEPVSWPIDDAALMSPEAWEPCPEHPGEARTIFEALAGWVRSTRPSPSPVAATWIEGRLVLPPLAFLPSGYAETIGDDTTGREAWRAVAELAASPGNGSVALTLGVAFGGLYLALFRREPYLFHLAGSTTLGKTTALTVAAAVLGYPGEPGNADNDQGTLRTWNATGQAPGRVLAELGCLPYITDELGASGRTAAQLEADIFRYADGAGRQTAIRTGGYRTGAAWCSAFVSSGNNGLAHVTENEGLPVRVFEHRGQVTSGETEADRLKELALTAYGHPLAWVVTDPRTAEMRRAIDRALDALRNDCGREVVRLAKHAASAVAGAGYCGHSTQYAITIPHTSTGLSWCNLKAFKCGACMFAGGAGILLGAAMIVVSGFAGKGPMAPVINVAQGYVAGAKKLPGVGGGRSRATADAGPSEASVMRSDRAILKREGAKRETSIDASYNTSGQKPLRSVKDPWDGQGMAKDA